MTIVFKFLDMFNSGEFGKEELSSLTLDEDQVSIRHSFSMAEFVNISLLLNFLGNTLHFWLPKQVSHLQSF